MKWIIAPVIVIISFCLLVMMINFYLSPSDELEKADAIIAISGGDTEARALKAAQLYNDDIADVIIFSGAALDPLSPSNAEAMREVALEQGVHGADIVIEESASNTEENAKHSQNIVNQQGYKKIVLVTSPYHQRRAYLEFQDKLGDEVEILNQSSEDESWSSTWWLTPWGWWLGVSESVKTAYTAARNIF